MEITAVRPAVAIEGGEVVIEATDWPVDRYREVSVWFGDQPGHIVLQKRNLCRVRVPTDATGEGQVRLRDAVIAEFRLTVGQRVLSDIHAVDNPVVDHLGYVYTTYSGTRDETPPVSVFRLGPDGTVEHYVTAIRNATSLALDVNDHLYVSSRFEGRVYKVLDRDQLEVYAEGLGVPFGLAFNRENYLFVGDREGKIYKISSQREVSVFAELPASPIAYHLAFDPDGNLFVAVPQLASDTIYMIDALGNVIPYYSGLGRPHGMAFDDAGNLYVCQGRVHDSGVFRFDAQGHIRKVIASPPVVGLTFDENRNVWLATPQALYRIAVPPEFFE
ncbi:Virginiamycin B lyase [bacterium HR11]|nr:Virginiamycin B lyase [bacterium HR11]